MDLKGETVDFALYQLRSFESVDRLCSISKAARSLGYSQSTVTTHIRALEKQLGVRLFQRLPHGVRITPPGETFRVYVARILSIVRDMTHALGEDRAVRGRLTLGVPATLVDQVAGPLVGECQLRHPELLLVPRVLAAVDIPAALLAGDIDLGLTLDADDPEPSDLPWDPMRGLDSRMIAPVDFFPVSRQEHAQGETTLLLVDGTCPSQLAFTGLVEQRWVTPAATVEIGSVGAAHAVARSGFGIAMLPLMAAQRDELATVLWLPTLRMHARLAWSASARLSQAARSVIDLATALDQTCHTAR